MRLVPSPPGRISRGEIRFAGRDLLRLPERQMRDIRGGAISMIFQEPMTSLNPVFTVGDQIMETVRRHERLGQRAARAKRARDARQGRDSRARSSGSTSIPTSSRAACASG